MVRLIVGGFLALIACVNSSWLASEVLAVELKDKSLPKLALKRIHDDLKMPVDMQSPPDGSGRLFIVEQEGRIRISANGRLQNPKQAFLDISPKVASGGERGLLGMAFHPNYSKNGRFFVNYTTRGRNKGATIVAEYRVSEHPDRADFSSAKILLTIQQPYPNHNGGQLQFGPDGMLYIGTGDGGGGCDIADSAQDPGSLLGKMLRLDPDNRSHYIPQDNPYLSDELTRNEIWGRGLRNPWRYSFDPQTGDLYIADVGQNAREEVSVVSVDPAKPLNFGWRTWEGRLSPPQGCRRSKFSVPKPVSPVMEYAHPEGCSIIGGYVYRGEAIPALNGFYFYSDYCSAFLRAFRYRAGKIEATVDLSDSIRFIGGKLQNPTSFGTDGKGELYILDADGEMFKLIEDKSFP